MDKCGLKKIISCEVSIFFKNLYLCDPRQKEYPGEILGQALAPFVMIPSWLGGWLARNEARKQEKALFHVGASEGGRGKER